MTVAQLKSSLDADELAHWMAYDQLDPIGGYRLDANFAQLVMHQVGDEDSKLSDFLLVDPDPISEVSIHAPVWGATAYLVTDSYYN